MSRFEPDSVVSKLPLVGIGDAVLIDCNIAKNCDPARNVFLLNSNGDVLWQIEAGVSSHGVIGYSAIYLDPNNVFMAYSSNGFEYEIDAKTGRILGKDLIR